jgi:hypothetical protein
MSKMLGIGLAGMMIFASATAVLAQSTPDSQRGPYTPDIRTPPTGKSHDFQGGGGQYYKRSKARKHHSHSPANS